MEKLGYLQRFLAAQFGCARFSCPNFRSPRNQIIDRKFLITQLRCYSNCHLMFCRPNEDPTVNLSSYENEYKQGLTTDTPSGAALAEMKRTNFSGTEKDYSYYINVLIQLGLKSGTMIFDYDCSWSYGS
jgi:hypothetical protein